MTSFKDLPLLKDKKYLIQNQSKKSNLNLVVLTMRWMNKNAKQKKEFCPFESNRKEGEISDWLRTNSNGTIRNLDFNVVVPLSSCIEWKFPKKRWHIWSFTFHSKIWKSPKFYLQLHLIASNLTGPRPTKSPNPDRSLHKTSTHAGVHI